jgi:hypothetical protein
MHNDAIEHFRLLEIDLHEAISRLSEPGKGFVWL